MLQLPLPSDVVKYIVSEYIPFGELVRSAASWLCALPLRNQYGEPLYLCMYIANLHNNPARVVVKEWSQMSDGDYKYGAVEGAVGVLRTIIIDGIVVDSSVTIPRQQKN